MKCDIVIYGDPILREKAKRIENVDQEVRRLARGMLDAMYRYNGVGLAAEQVGRDVSICVIDIPPTVLEQADAKERVQITSMPLVMINPVIQDAGGEQTDSEGCLSIPEIFIPVKRSAELTVSYVTLDNEEKTISVSGFLARVIQHEMDHLNGRLLVDHMSPVKRITAAGKLKKLRKSGKR